MDLLLPPIEVDENYDLPEFAVRDDASNPVTTGVHPVEEIHCQRPTTPSCSIGSSSSDNKCSPAIQETPTIPAPPDNSTVCIGMIIEVPIDFDGSSI